MGLVIDGFVHVMPKRFLETLVKAYPPIELKELAPLTSFGEMQNTVRILDMVFI
jgi:hypothetical protein